MWFVNLFVNAATNLVTGNNMLGGLIVALIAGAIFLFVCGIVTAGKRASRAWGLLSFC
jgi:hypothetical protein